MAADINRTFSFNVKAVRSAASVQPAAQPMAAAAANGTPDYSAQWAEYYRSQGKIKEAEEIEAQMKQKVLFFYH